MSTKNLKLTKGDAIIISNTSYKVASTTNIRVRKGKEDTQEAEPMGEHRTDEAEPIDKKIVLSIIQRKIKKLEQKELFTISGDDVLFEFGDEEIAPQATISDHILLVEQITNLQEILKEIKAL